MRNFKYINDVQDWLEPMDYQGFWVAIAPYDLVVQPRWHCDQQIADGAADQATVLAVVKDMARIELVQREGLQRRPITPWLQLVESH